MYGRFRTINLRNTFWKMLHHVLKSILEISLCPFRFNMRGFARKETTLNRYCWNFNQNYKHPWWGLMFRGTLQGGLPPPVLVAKKDTDNFPKRLSGALLCTLSKLFRRFFFYPTPSIEAVYFFICGRRSVAVARYRMEFSILSYCDLVLGQSIGVTTVTPPVSLNRFTSAQPSH